MPWNAHFYTVTLPNGKKYTVVCEAYHWAEVEKALGIKRKHIVRGADLDKNDWLSRIIYKKRK